MKPDLVDGIFQNIMVEKAACFPDQVRGYQHWQGEGNHQTDVPILHRIVPTFIVTSQPTGR
jgi:hypothetical protein